MSEFYVGASAKILSDVLDDCDNVLSGRIGEVWKIGTEYVWLRVDAAIYPYEHEELVLIPNLPATDTGD